jgi:hypothetical protein
MSKQYDQSEPDDAGIEELLRQVGSRDEPAADVMDEVRGVVHAEWRSMVRARVRRRHLIGYAMAAGIACAALAATLTLRTTAPAAMPVATVARADGHLQIVGTDARDLLVGQRIATGETVHTDAQTRAAFDFGNGLSVRADTDSTFRLAASDRLILVHGALYVDAARTAAVLSIQTPAGSVRHVGTQYQVRTLSDDVVISVREGRVEVSGAHGTNAGDAGERLHLSTSGNVQRSRIAAYDESWRWASAVAPTFDIGDQPLSTFLAWVARETGRTLVYQSASAEAMAASVRLRGSIAGLDANAALAAVLPTTSLRRYETADDSIGIALAAAIESSADERPTP